jgi:hypothetical protein
VWQVVQAPTGKIQLIVSYSPWFGWSGRPVAVPIEAVDIRQAAGRARYVVAGVRKGSDLV